MSKTFRRGLGIAVLVALLAVAAFVIARPFALLDWVRLRGYTPPAEIVALADDTDMTGQARHMFYVNHPSLKDKQDFRGSCPKYDNQTIVIGCYQGGQRGINILRVDDERLAGVEEVTAAHEMLHAAYERLGKGERQRIDGLLQNYADTQLKNERVIAALKGYETSEPGQQHNEMHSIFGTEIADLPPELEEYYARYFTSRRTVVGYAERYQGAFTSRRAAIEKYDSQLQTMNQQIQTNLQTLKDRGAEIEAERHRLDAAQAAGDIDGYNAGVAPFNARIDGYNSLLADTKSLIARHNTLVEERNSIAAQTVELQAAIDSSKLPKQQ